MGVIADQPAIAEGERAFSPGTPRGPGWAWDVSPVLEVWIDPDVKPVIVEIAGTLTAESAAPLRQALAELASTRDLDRDLFVDMCDVDFADVAGLGALTGALRRSRPSGRICWLLSPSRAGEAPGGPGPGPSQL